MKVVAPLPVDIDDIPPLVEEVVGCDVHGVGLHRPPHRWIELEALPTAAGPRVLPGSLGDGSFDLVDFRGWRHGRRPRCIHGLPDSGRVGFETASTLAHGSFLIANSQALRPAVLIA